MHLPLRAEARSGASPGLWNTPVPLHGVATSHPLFTVPSSTPTFQPRHTPCPTRKERGGRAAFEQARRRAINDLLEHAHLGLHTHTRHERYATPTQRTIASPGRGILAMDESNATIGKRLDSIGLENSEKNRQAYREILVGGASLPVLLAKAHTKIENVV